MSEELDVMTKEQEESWDSAVLSAVSAGTEAAVDPGDAPAVESKPDAPAPAQAPTEAPAAPAATDGPAPEAPAAEEKPEEAPAEPPQLTTEEINYLLQLQQENAAKQLTTPPAPAEAPAPAPEPAAPTQPAQQQAPQPAAFLALPKHSDEAKEALMTGDFTKYEEETDAKISVAVQNALMMMPQVAMQTTFSKDFYNQIAIGTAVNNFIDANPEIEDIHEQFQLALANVMAETPNVDFGDRRQIKSALEKAKQKVGVALSIREKLKTGAARKIDARVATAAPNTPGTGTQPRPNPGREKSIDPATAGALSVIDLNVAEANKQR